MIRLISLKISIKLPSSNSLKIVYNKLCFHKNINIILRFYSSLEITDIGKQTFDYHVHQYHITSGINKKYFN